MQSRLQFLVFFFLQILFVFWSVSCNNSAFENGNQSTQVNNIEPEPSYETKWCYEGITEFKRGDLIVKPNINILPGSAIISNGVGFGHAAIVTSGFKHENIDTLMANIVIIESVALDVPKAFQIREISGYIENESVEYNNTGFGPKKTGTRYRLRYNFSDNQIDSIIQFIREQKNDYSNWNAMKRFPESSLPDSLIIDAGKKNWADNSHWYCSLLIWQPALFVTGIDLDPNGGYYVYPNDLISSHYFDNTVDGERRRVRF
ncbi:MAG: hypothetical protein KAG99_09195 [Bacteroidales bacterium]|nr:hypothetical protein [Bacteroidales bacterium]